MQRLMILAAALLCLSMPPTARGLQAPQAFSQPLRPAPPPAVQKPILSLQAQTLSLLLLPADDNPIQQRLHERLEAGEVTPDTLSREQIQQRISRTYLYHANFLLARAAGSDEQAVRLLERAVDELSGLLLQPGIQDHLRFRELYRTILAEYTRFHSPPDTRPFRRGDLVQLRADMFLAHNETGVPLLSTSLLPELQPGLRPHPAETVIEMTTNRLVLSSIDYLFRQPEEHLYLWLSRAETYLPMIEQIFAEEGVPDELKYLAMVESGLNPAARSWAQAAGMWQFVSATARAYGLQINHWVDERLDPEKSTRAAARHLRDLHQLFGGDWQLALAGYNCSPARIKQAMRSTRARLGRKATFWDIYHDIPRETRNYVPMFIAAALVTSNPEAFNVPEVTPGPRYEYDRVPVHGLFSLHTIAEFAGTDVATLRALNPELKRSVTPPTHTAYHLRLPLGSYERFIERYAQIPEDERRSLVQYTVRRGDVLGQIASRYGVSASALMRTNGLRSTTIHPGQRLIVPVPDYSSEKADLANAQPARVRYARLVRRPVEAASAEPAAVRMTSTAAAGSADKSPTPAESETAESQTRVVYQVRRGDTLGRIARRYGVSIGEIKTWNDLSGSTIRTGQRLYLYTEKGPAAEPAAERTVYRVRRGDTLGRIASEHGVQVSDLKRWNNLRSSTIHPGQKLEIHR